MRLSGALFLLLAAQVAAFRSSLFSSRFVPSVASSRTLSAKNILDDIPIEGDLMPLSNNLLIRVKEMVASTRGGLFIPDNAKERPTEGVVVACGPGRMHPETLKVMDNSAQIGDNVLYGKYDGMELKYNGINHKMIKDDDVLLKFSGGELTLENVVPVKDQVLVRLPEKEEKNSAGIIVNTPSSQEKRPTAGVVVKVGPGLQISNGEYSPIQVQPGDGVKFREYGGNQVKIQGKEYMVVRAHDIVAKWQP
jgi:chaperonin GroES